MHGLQQPQLPHDVVGPNMHQREKESNDDEIQVINFNAESDESNVMSVIIDNPLTMESSLKAVLDEGYINDELDVDFDTDKIKKVNTKRNNCSDVAIRIDKLQSMAAKKLLKIKSMHAEYLITFKDIQRLK